MVMPSSATAQLVKRAVRDEVAAGLLHALRVRSTSLAKPLFTVLPDSLPADSAARRFGVHLAQAGGGRVAGSFNLDESGFGSRNKRIRKIILNPRLSRSIFES